jgi:hypothetical protein
MKKILAGIAILAVAGMAQAALLNTWTLSGAQQTGNEKNPQAANIDKVTFGDLTRNGLGEGSATSGAMFGSNNWTENNNISFTIDVASDYEIAGAELGLEKANAVSAGPKELQWKLDGTAVGSAWTLSTATGGSTIGVVDFGTIAAGSHTATLNYAGTGQAGGGAGAATSSANVRLYGPMTFSGDIQAASSPSSVPEPATMSLLGLGALAMVIRRKLSK